jgi:hypothetical protein
LSHSTVTVTMFCKRPADDYNYSCEYFRVDAGQEYTAREPYVWIILIKMYSSDRAVVCQATEYPLMHEGSPGQSWEIHGPPCKLVRV